MLDDPRLSTALQAVAEGRSLDPFTVLGRHSMPSGDIIRVILPPHYPARPASGARDHIINPFYRRRVARSRVVSFGDSQIIVTMQLP